MQEKRSLIELQESVGFDFFELGVYLESDSDWSDYYYPPDYEDNYIYY
ncbi:MAG: hypothetical protein AAB691_02910 [Patescibacteria group bacterium]